MWIFDGLDELELLISSDDMILSKKAFSLFEFLMRDDFQINFRKVIFLSRPNVSKIPKNITISLEMDGVEENEKIVFIQKFFQEEKEKEKLALKIMKKNILIKKNLSIPFYLEYFCLIMKENDQLLVGEDLNCKIGKFFDVLIDYSIENKIFRNNNNDILQKIKIESKEFTKIIKSILSILSFYALKEKKFFISQILVEKITYTFLTNPIQLDIFSFDKTTLIQNDKEPIIPLHIVIECILKIGIFKKMGDQFHFLHYSIQEFFSSYFISHSICDTSHRKLCEQMKSWMKLSCHNFDDLNLMIHFIFYFLTNKTDSLFYFLDIFFNVNKFQLLFARNKENLLRHKKAKLIGISLEESYSDENLSTIKKFVENLPKKWNFNIFLKYISNFNLISILISFKKNLVDHNKRTFLHYYFLNHNISLPILQLISNKIYISPNIVDKNGKTVLHYASSNPNITPQIFQYLFEIRCDPNIIDFKKFSSLHYLSCQNNHFKNHFDLFDILIKNKARVSIKDKRERICLHYFSKNKFVSSHILNLLIENKSEINSKDDKKQSPLHFLSLNSNISKDNLLLFLENSADPNLQNIYQKSPFINYFSNDNQNMEIYQLFFEKKVNIELKDINGQNGFHSIAKNNHISISLLNYLLSSSPNLSNIDIKDKYGNSPLYYLHQNKKSESENIIHQKMELFLQHNINPNTYNKYNKSILHYVCESERINEKVLKLLLENKGEVNVFSFVGKNCLHYLCENKNITFDSLNLLLTNNANPNLISSSSSIAPLHFLISNPKLKLSPPLLRLLLSNKADPNFTINGMNALLHLLQNFNNSNIDQNLFELIKIFIDFKININDTNFLGETALHILLSKGKKLSKKIILILLNNKADPNLLSYKRKTSLHCLCKNEMIKKEILELLIEKNASLQFFTLRKKKTPLHYLFSNKNANQAIISVFPFLSKLESSEMKKVDHLGRNVLHYSSLNPNISFPIFQFLLSNHFNLNLVDKYNKSSLHYLTNNNNNNLTFQTLQCFLDNKCDFSLKDNLERTPLHYFAESKEIESLKNLKLFLENSDVSSDNFDLFGNDYLHIFAQNKYLNIDLIKVLVEYKMDLQKTDLMYNKNILHFVAENNGEIIDENLIQFLLEKGVDFNLKDTFQKTFLHYYFSQTFPLLPSVFSIFNEISVDFNLKDNFKKTPLHYFFENAMVNIESLEKLKQNKNINFYSTDKYGRSYLHYYSINQHCYHQVFDFLSQFVLPNNKRKWIDKDGRNFLHFACLNPSLNVEILKSVVSLKVDVNKIDMNASSSLIYALKNKNFNVEILKVLLESKSRVDYCYSLDGRNSFTLFLSSFFPNSNESYQIIHLLLQSKCDPNLQDSSGDYPLSLLSHSSKKFSLHHFKILLDAKCDPNCRDLSLFTPLHILSNSSQIEHEKIELLLLYKAKVNLLDFEGKSPLHLLSKNKNPNFDSLQLLLSSKASLGQLDHDGKSPKDYLKENDSIPTEILNKLEKNLKKEKSCIHF